MKTLRLKIDRLRALRDIAMQLPAESRQPVKIGRRKPVLWSQATYGSRLSKPEHGCGTSMCLLGFAGSDPRFKAQGLGLKFRGGAIRSLANVTLHGEATSFDADDVHRFFGIDVYTAYQLFGPTQPKAAILAALDRVIAEKAAR